MILREGGGGDPGLVERSRIIGEIPDHWRDPSDD